MATRSHHALRLRQLHQVMTTLQDVNNQMGSTQPNFKNNQDEKAVNVALSGTVAQLI